MPAYSPLTKQDLLARLKEQEEAHKQKRLDILQRVKSLEARKKYIKELKSWLERRKLTVTDLLAMYRDLMPKRAERPVKSKNSLQPIKKSAGEQLVDAMHEARIIEIDTKQARDLVERLGYKRASYSHIINSAMIAGLLRKGNRDGNGWKYVVTGGGSSPQAGKLLNRPVKLVGNGDPAFCKAIREARLAKGWNHAEVGKKVGTSHASIANWESGRYTPKEEMRQKIVKLFDLPSDLGAAATAAAKARAATHTKITNGQATML